MPQDNGSPVGIAADVKGVVSVTHPDGTHEALTKGAPVYQGDTIETDAQGAVNVTFEDHTVFAISNDAQMTIDEFVYDPAKHGEGAADISVVRGVFLYTSGFVGKEDPTDVKIQTPVGSIGIRGTTLTGYLPPEGSSEQARISLIEGKILVQPTGGGEFLLTQSRETVQIDTQAHVGQNLGVLPTTEFMEHFTVVRSVAPALFVPALEGVHTLPGAEAPAPTPGEAPSSSDLPPQDAGATGDAPKGDAAPPPAEGQPLLPPSAPGELPPPDAPLLQDPLMIEGGLLPAPNGPFAGTLMGMPPFSGELLTLSGTSPILPPLLPPPPLGMAPLPLSGPAPLPTTTSGTNTTTTLFDPTLYTPHALTASFTAFEQPGVGGGVHSFDSAHFFSDPNGDPLSYIIKGIYDPTGALQSASFDANGQLIFTITPGFTVSGTPISAPFQIQIAATDGTFTSPTVTFTFDAYEQNLPGGPLLDGNPNNPSLFVTGGYHFSTLDGDDQVTIGGTSLNNVAFGGLGNDDISLGSGGNKAYGEGGNDTMSITGGAGNLISGGEGNDTLIVGGGTGSFIYGGAGNDLIQLSAGPLTQLANNAMMIDAGSGFDTLKFSGSINFSGVTANSLHSIDRIEAMGTGTVTLDLSDILEHTDNKTLFFDGNANTVLNVNNSASLNSLSLVAANTSNPYNGADASTYNMYSNGNLTLYISTDTGATNAAAAIA